LSAGNVIKVKYYANFDSPNPVSPMSTYPNNVIIYFTRYTSGELANAASIIKEELIKNAATFPGLPVSSATIGTQIAALRTASGQADYYGKVQDVKAARKALEKSLRKNGNFINELAEGKEVILARSGYPRTKPRYPVGDVGQASFKKVTSIPGGFQITLKKLPKVRTYIICALPKEAAKNSDFQKWPWYPFPKTAGVISNLELSTRYKLVAVAIATNGRLVFSDPIEVTTQ
jgi:hypothetical protein